MEDFFMLDLNQNILNEYTSYLKNDKYKNKILNLNLEYCIDSDGEYILINMFLIKKSVRGLGYGSAILYDLIKFANTNNVRIIFKMEFKLKSLQSFYIKNGFTLIKNDIYYLIYIPQK